jgi:hypothetical protein
VCSCSESGLPYRPFSKERTPHDWSVDPHSFICYVACMFVRWRPLVQWRSAMVDVEAVVAIRPSRKPHVPHLHNNGRLQGVTCLNRRGQQAVAVGPFRGGTSVKSDSRRAKKARLAVLPPALSPTYATTLPSKTSSA